MILPITLTIAAAAAILHVWMSLRVSRLRRHFRVSIGDGGNEALARRMRAHGNFAENMPIFLILLVLWLLGVVSGTTLGGFVHILLIIAIAVILIRLIQGRPAV
jgi:uncharacterized protein